MFKNNNIISIILVLMILLTNFSTVFAQNNNELETQSKDYNNENIIDQSVVDLLENENIEYLITKDNIIQLKNLDTKEISMLNNKLSSNFNQETLSKTSVSKQSKYPTEWYHVKTWDRRTNKRFIKATKTAFAAGVTSWVFGWAIGAKEIGKRAAAAFGTYYFVNNEKSENVYYSTKHYYRILGPGRFDSNGNHMGDYHLKRVDRTTKSSNHTGGQVGTKYQKSTILTSVQ